MSTNASDLIELAREPRTALIEQTLRRLALNIISQGVKSVHAGC